MLELNLLHCLDDLDQSTSLAAMLFSILRGACLENLYMRIIVLADKTAGMASVSASIHILPV